MIGETESAYDYDYIQKDLANLLLRELWNQKSRQRFLAEFVNVPFPVDPAIPPFVGVGVSESENHAPQLEFLSTLDTMYLDIEKLLSRKGWGAIRFHVWKTGRILACSRPAQGGDSIGHRNGETGTLGCVVKDRQVFEQQYILSCNHVLASINKGERMKDEIWQPGQKYGGTPADRIGVLAKYKGIVLGPEGSNNIDAALCKPDNPSHVTPGLRHLGVLNGYLSKPVLNIPVSKEGCVTAVTHGFLRMRNVSHTVRYNTGDEAVFDGQFAIIGASESGFFE